MNKIPPEGIQADEGKPQLRLRDFITTITGATGLFVALLWVAGRIYAGGYFGAMNILSYQVNFSLWEYVEVGWLPVIIYSLGVTLAASLVGLVLEFVWGVMRLIYVKFIGDKLKKVGPLEWIHRLLEWARGLLRQIGQQAPRLRVWLRLLGFYVPLLSGVLFAVLTLGFVSSCGEANGKLYVLQSAPQLDLVSGSPLGLESGSTFSPPSGDSTTMLFVYRGYRLLTYNNGKYYLFKELDPTTCRPKQVYVIDEKQLVQVTELPASSMASECSSTTSPNSEMQPTSTSTSPAP